VARAERIDPAERLSRFSEHWSPRIMETLDGHGIKLVRVQGAFVWPGHPDADELFLVLEGCLRMEFRDRAAVELTDGQMIVVPRGVEHRPVAEEECALLLFERRGLVNTGDAPPGALTQARRETV